MLVIKYLRASFTKFYDSVDCNHDKLLLLCIVLSRDAQYEIRKPLCCCYMYNLYKVQFQCQFAALYFFSSPGGATSDYSLQSFR